MATSPTPKSTTVFVCSFANRAQTGIHCFLSFFLSIYSAILYSVSRRGWRRAYFRAAAPDMISISSRVMTAWRVRLKVSVSLSIISPGTQTAAVSTGTAW